jgi:transposase
MLYLAIDQHRKQLTVNLRQENGDVLLRRQVSTHWSEVRAFLAELQERSVAEGGYLVIIEVCGFNDWLLELLREYGAKDIVLLHPEKPLKQKTDRRDANRLGELLWVNRQRLLAGQRVQGLRRVVIASPGDRQDRRLTTLRWRLGRERTRVVNRIKQLLRRHNLEQRCPTKGIQTQKARQWLEELPLVALDRWELDRLLASLTELNVQRQGLQEQLRQRQGEHALAPLLATLPGAGAFGSLALACRIGDIERFPRPRSLANYWGLTPGCRNSGDAKRRLGSITKQGSALVRFILGQMVVHVLRRDGRLREWYKGIRRRRGSKIARVAVMRRLATIIWHMVKEQRPYVVGGLRAAEAAAAVPAAVLPGA